MKAVAPHTFFIIASRQGKHVIDERMRAMEGGVETRDLPDMRPSLARR